MAERNKITLTVNGKNYTLVHDETEDYMKRIEHYLNAKIETASKAGEMWSSMQLPTVMYLIGFAG